MLGHTRGPDVHTQVAQESPENDRGSPNAPRKPCPQEWSSGQSHDAGAYAVRNLGGCFAIQFALDYEANTRVC